MMASINVLTERQSHIMVVMQKMNAVIGRSTKDEPNKPDFEPFLNTEVKDFEIFCKRLQHIGALRNAFVSAHF